MQFSDYILEEMTKAKELEGENALTQILKKLVEKDSAWQNVKQLSEKCITKQYA